MQINANNMFTAEELEQTNALEQQQREAALRRRMKAARKERNQKRLVAYKFEPDSGNLPCVGQTVAICHRTTQDKQGQARLERTGVTFEPIVQVFLSDADGHHVKTRGGDVWTVRPAAQGNAKWETFRPGEKQLVLVK